MKKPENKFTMRKCYLLICLLLAGALMTNRAYAQNVLDPDDPVINYDPNNPPQIPPYGTISKWVRTPRFSWNTDNYKAYFYKGIAFRLLFPPSYKSNPDKKYPLLLFLHGEGEKASIYDDELHLRNCARKIQDSVLKGSFDAFVLFPQTTYGGWAGSQFTTLYELINYMINNVQVDRYRIIVSGLSSGGDGTWNFTELYPKLVSACIPISAATANESQPGFINTIKTIPIWLSQGGKDNNPPPSFTDGVVENFRNAGIDIRTVEPRQAGIGLQSEGYYVTYPNNAHNTWDVHYAEPQAFQYMLRAYKSNPHVVSGRREFCPGTALNVHLELTPGFDAYEWSRNGVIIDGANTNTLTVTDTGTYAARIKDGGIWSDWSHWPAHITYKATTQTPPIQISGLMSGVIPAPDGNTSVKLEEPEGYASYEWRNSSGQIVGTNRIFTAGQPGKYVAEVTEVYGCSAHPSDSFYVVPSNGPNAPDPASDLTGYALSQTSIQLNWSNNLHPENNETAFEIYRSTQPGSGYTLAAIVPADTLGYVDDDLMANTNYYYIVRAVNNTGAATPTTEIKVTTIADKLAPAAPGNLSVIGSNDNSIALSWNASADNVSVTNYYIYIDGVKSYATPDTLFQIYNLTASQKYLFTVKAVDPSGNLSPSSNQVVASAINSGLTYKYYTGSWSTLPNLSTLTPVKSGFLKNISTTPATQSTNYAFSFQGYINIIKPGTYTFYTNSDDGSNLYINNSRVVNNDGAHGTVEKSGTYTFNSPGRYSFRVDYFQGGGSASLSTSWAATNLGIPKSAIPDSVFKVTKQAGNMPSRPVLTQTTAVSYHQINLHWTDNSNNETGFEIYRSTGNGSPWQIIATTAPDITAYEDTLVSPSTTYYYKVQAINKNGGSGYDMGSISGLNYSYYESPANLSTMPDFNSLQSVETGNVPNVTLSVKNRSSNYALKFEGWINIATAGNYTFYTKSDDGSILYIDGFDQDHIVVNNNYSQSPTERSGSITLSPGRHAIYITFFQGTGGDFLSASYAGPGISKQIIPDMVFANPKSYATTPGLPAAPIAPNNLKAEMINTTTVSLSWKDRSNNETAFRIYRSDGNNTNYRMLKELPKNDSLFINDGLYPNTTYYYKIEAVNIGGESGFSNEVSILTTPPQQVIYVNFNDGTNQAGGYWNNTNDPDPNYGDEFPSLKDSIGNTTNVGLKVVSHWEKRAYPSGNPGKTTGNDTGIFPDNVLMSSYVSGAYQPQSIEVSGLDTAYRYNFTFFGNTQTSKEMYTSYQIGSKQVSLNTTNNTSNAVSINNIKPDDNGTVTFTLAGTMGSNIAYINALVIHKNTILPAKAGGLTLTNVSDENNNSIHISWSPNYSNVSDTFKIYRSKQLNGPYTLLNPGVSNRSDTAYIDTNIEPVTKYYYYLVAVNKNGNSLPSDTVSITTLTTPPSIADIPDIYAGSGKITTVQISAAELNGATPSFSLQNYPSFMDFQDNHDGTATLTLHPSANDIGRYDSLKIIAVNEDGSTGSRYFKAFVTDDGLTNVIYMNFTDPSHPYRSPWNDLIYRNFTNHRFNNLVNSFGKTTNISVNIIQTWPGSQNYGVNTYNNSGVFPDSVMSSYYYINDNNSRTIQISGLDPNQKYNLLFFGSSTNGGNTNYTTIYAVNDQKDSVNNLRNSSKVIRFNGLTPDVSGNLTITVKKSASAYYGVLNAMVLEAYGSGTLISPSDLKATADTNSVVLRWQDRSYNESSLEIWRSTAINGPYSRINEVSANTTSYKDNTVSANTRYYYKIRAKISGGNPTLSAFSNIANVTTPQYAIYINFNEENPAPLPWNNTNTTPVEGQILYLLNSNRKNTGVILETGTGFSGVNPYGINTGNNSGIYPDNVISSTYWVDASDSGKLTIIGLNLSMSYNLTFFGSRAAGDDRTTIYLANGKKAALQVANNSSQAATISNVKPDENGSIHIEVTKGGNSPFGYIGSLIIQAHNNYDESGNLVSGPSDDMLARKLGMSSIAVETKKDSIKEDLFSVTNVYPNPFDQQINIKLKSPEKTKLILSLYDMMGRQIDLQQYDISEGVNTLQYRPRSGLMQGVYILSLRPVSAAKPVNVKLIKR